MLRTAKAPSQATPGALGGAAIAGIAHGNVGTGALAGGVGGAVIGGVGNQQNRQDIYSRAYWDCMNSGQRYAPSPQPVYDPVRPLPATVIRAAQRACANKYGSFRWSGPHAGQFQGFDGYWHWCNL